VTVAIRFPQRDAISALMATGRRFRVHELFIPLSSSARGKSAAASHLIGMMAVI